MKLFLQILLFVGLCTPQIIQAQSNINDAREEAIERAMKARGLE